jgi:putative transposase
VKGNKLIIPKFTEDIRYRNKSTISENIKHIVITKDVDRYYVSIQYEIDGKLGEGNGVVGLDMGIKHILTTSDVIEIEPLDSFIKREKKLKKAQRGHKERER